MCVAGLNWRRASFVGLEGLWDCGISRGFHQGSSNIDVLSWFLGGIGGSGEGLHLNSD